MFKKTENEVETQVSGSMKEPDRPAPMPAMGSKTVVHAVIGPSIVVKGELSGEEDVLIQGRVEGEVDLGQNNLIVGKEGFAKANVRARTITIEGEVEGDLFGEERVIIRQSGNIRGNINAPRVSLEDGARFKGSIDMEPQGASAGRSWIARQDRLVSGILWACSCVPSRRVASAKPARQGAKREV